MDSENSSDNGTSTATISEMTSPPKILVRSLSAAPAAAEYGENSMSVANGHHASTNASNSTNGDASSPTSRSVSSDHSSVLSYDSSPSISAIERAVANAPGVSTARPEYEDDKRLPPSLAISTPTTTTTATTMDDKTHVVPPQPRSTPVLERSRTASELLTRRQREFQSARGAHDKPTIAPYAAASTTTTITAPSFEIESVCLPAEAITEVEIDKTMHTVFAVEVRLHGGLQWIIKKRYSDFRELHERLKRTNASVKSLHFPKRHVFRNRHQSVIEQRRSELERYINEVLEIRPLIRVPLFNFLEVYVHMESYERKIQRHKKELESERMKNMLDPDLLEDLSTAFKRLCSSKYLFHGNTTTTTATTTTTNDKDGTTTDPSASHGTTKDAKETKDAGGASPVPTSPSKESHVSTPPPAGPPSVHGATAAPTTSSEKVVTNVNGTAPIPQTAGSQIYVSRACFRRDVLGVFPDMPSSFAMRFIKAVSDRQGADINMDEFFRAIAILRCGTLDDRLRFVFQMCDLDHAGKVQSNGLNNFLIALHGRHVLDRPEYRRILTDGFDQGRVRMSADDFVQVMTELEVQDLLVSWMDSFVDVLCETPDPQLLESQEEFNPVVQQKILATETQFSVKEVSLLQDAFNNYCVSGGGDSVDMDALSSDFPLEMTDTRFHKVFASFGQRANGNDIDIFSFVNALAIACRGTAKEKSHFAFKLFATVRDGTLMSRDDLYGMLRLDLAQNPELERLVAQFTEKNPLPTTKGSGKGLGSVSSSDSLAESGAQTPSVSGSQLGRFVDALMKEFGEIQPVSSTDDSVRALTMSQEHFMVWTTRENYEMAALRIMREVVFIDLGLVPSTKEEELVVAKGCYKPYDVNLLVEDDAWFLIEKKWFDHWCKYINLPIAETLSTTTTSSTSSLSDLSNKLSNVTKGAQDKSNTKEPPITDADGNYVRPKCINNYLLLTSGRERVLKSADDIKLGKHYGIIPEQLWMGLKLWYGGGPEIRRQVVITSDGSAVLDIWEQEAKKKKSDDEDDSEENGDVSDDTQNKQSQALGLRRQMRTGGSVGLSNLGNTCYMNSALQCLTNTQLLAEYFLSGMYLDDINRTSTLGLQGKLAEVYGKLAENMWCAKQKAISPRNFKKTIGKFNEAFRGTEQQDAQELLSFLLSGLSEDLNRIQNKPYVEQPDSDGRFDGDLADEWWRNHLRREVSIIVALFTGQYKSLLTCSECGFKSARFEPFTFLQLPLPEPTHNTITLVLVLSNGMAPMKVSVRLGISATIYDLKHELVKLCHSDFELPHITETDIKVCEYSGSMILSFKADNRRVGQIRSVERLIAFQLEPLSAETIQATRNRRPSYVPPALTHLRGGAVSDDNGTDGDKAVMAQFFDSLTEGSLVEVKVRAQSIDYVPGVIVTCPGVDDDQIFMVRLQRGEEQLQVPANRLRPRQARLLYIPLLSRKLSYSALYFKNPFRPAPFGLPSLVRICPELTSGLELYKLVWQRMKRYVESSPPTEWTKDDHAEALVSSRIDTIFRGLTSSCGFVLRRVESKGLTDSRANWLTRSFGQVIPCTSEPLDILEDETIAIDWDIQVFQDRVNLEKMKQIESHSSVEKNEAIDKGPVPLRHCLDAFTSEEKISEGYCSGCKKHLEMTKKLEIWRLPPVMVVHLKRFQYTQTYRRKLASLVEFPIHDLDLSSCVAPHVEIPERYPTKESSSDAKKGNENDTKPGDDESFVTTNGTAVSSPGSGNEKESGAISKGVDASSPGSANGTAHSPAPTAPSADVVAPTQGGRIPVANRVRRGYTNTNLDESRCLETKYDLYGVVNHQGALGGGHYTAYAQNFVDGQWYFYDDERVRVIEESKVVTPSAYLLFYLRSDMKGVLVKDMFPQNTNKAITDADIDRFVEQGDDRRCSIM